ncbi:ferrous iron transport protein B [Weeksellaceae bacterium TAE3-ERU29]|nr:ferrous iron transport protein B [Weeksellaceae bacterium TAE3-ERU29]
MDLLKIALIGNPNMGKSTLFNALTGLKQRIGNYPGTTVEKRQGEIVYKNVKIRIYDYPGTYTVYPKSADEEVVFNNLNNPEGADFPDKVIVVGSPLQLKRGLLLYQQVRDLGLPVIFVLNMVDEAQKKGFELNTEALKEYTEDDILLLNARTGKNLNLLKDRIIKDFPAFEENFEISTIYKEPVEEIKEKFKVGNYKAWQYLAHTKIIHLPENDREFIQSVKDKYHLVPERMQVTETVKRHSDIEVICNKTISSKETKKQRLADKLDRVFTHPFWGYVIFFILLFLAFQAIFSWAEAPQKFIEESFGELQKWINNNFDTENPLVNLIADGIIPGIGGIVVFVPQIFILTFFLLILEESGYMSRVVFLMDKWMRPFGLNGKSVVPLMSGAACAIPGILAARNIENNKERLITMLVTPFMTCSARLPVYSALIALVIPNKSILGFNLQGIFLMGLYLLGVLAALFFAYAFKKMLKTPYKSYLIMEIPDYRIPHWRNVLLGLWEKVSSFVFGAGKIILAVSVILWVLASYGFSKDYKNAEEIVAKEAKVNNWDKDETANHLESYKLENSLLGGIGKTIEPVFRPLGYDWKISIGVVSSFAAREVFNSTMSSIYSLGKDNEDENRIVSRMRNEIRPNGEKVYSLATGVSLMLFYAFAMQCLSTLAIVRKETGSWKWPMAQLVLMTGFAYIVSMIAYQALS